MREGRLKVQGQFHELRKDKGRERGLTLPTKHAHVPLRGHAQHGAHDSKACCDRRCNAKWEVVGFVVVIGVVVRPEPFAENEVLLDEDGRVDGEPVREEDKESVEPGLEMRGADDGEDNVDYRADYDEEDTRDLLREGTKDLEGKCEGVL